MITKRYFRESKWMKSVAMIVSLVLPLLTIFLPFTDRVAENHYRLGFPFQFLNYYGEYLPNQMYSLFTWGVFKNQVLFNLPMYILNAALIYLIIMICSVLIKKRVHAR